jgi:hypothetical protein
MYSSSEVVRVISDHSLIDSESYEHRYHPSRPITPGFYIVVWPADVSCTRYDETARFVGPYVRRNDAEAAMESGLEQARDWLKRVVRRADAGFAVELGNEAPRPGVSGDLERSRLSGLAEQREAFSPDGQTRRTWDEQQLHA